MCEPIDRNSHCCHACEVGASPRRQPEQQRQREVNHGHAYSIKRMIVGESSHQHESDTQKHTPSGEEEIDPTGILQVQVQRLRRHGSKHHIPSIHNQRDLGLFIAGEDAGTRRTPDSADKGWRPGRCTWPHQDAWRLHPM